MELSPDQRQIRDFYFKEALGLAADRNFLHAASRFAPERIFTLEDLRRHVNAPSLDLNYLAVFRGGKPVDLAEAACFKVVQRRKIPFVDRRVLERHFAAGAACVLEGVDVLEPGINALATAIDRAQAASFSNATVFFSQHGNEAYRGHADTDDVLVLHLAGEKKWRLHHRLPPRRTNLNELNEAQMGPLGAEVTMRPGDLMFVRSYTPHRVQTLTPWSLHLSFDLCDRTVNVETALDALVKRFDQDAAYPLTPTAAVLHKLQALAADPRFAEDIARLQAQERAGHEEFRRLVASNRVAFFDRYIAEAARARGALQPR